MWWMGRCGEWVDVVDEFLYSVGKLCMRRFFGAVYVVDWLVSKRYGCYERYIL